MKPQQQAAAGKQPACRPAAHLLRATLLGLLLALVLAQPEATRASWLTSPLKSIQKAFSSGPGSASSPNKVGASTSSSNNNADNTNSTTIKGRSADINGEETTPTNASSGALNDFEVKCFTELDPALREAPRLYFFSASGHSNESLGCSVETEIELSSTKTDDSSALELTIDADYWRGQLIDSGQYNGSLPTYFLIHGFLSTWDGDNWMCNIKDLVLNSSQANVFIVDWSGGSKPLLPLDYGRAVSNTKYVSQLLGSFVNWLLEASGQPDASRFHMIGHSLGAHISGFVGYAVQNLGRITGLDPAGPCFSTEKHDNEQRASNDGYLPSNRRRLSPESAQFVLALHTDIGLFGLNENCAHYDVYVNGGFKQPSCGAPSLASRVKNLLHLNLADSLNPNIVCAHSFSHQLLEVFVGLFDQTRLRQLISNTLEHVPGGNMLVRQESPDGQMIATPDGNPNRPPEERCYPMAYECDDWEAFRAGECGFCLDQDPKCVYTGLSLQDYQLRKLYDAPVSSRSGPAARRGPSSDGGTNTDDDDKFNDENEDDDGLGTNDAPNSAPGKPSTVNTRGQHFIKSGAKKPTCLFHYQVIVAAKRGAVVRQRATRKHYYYLHLPLEEAGTLTDERGTRYHDRLVQVSHRIEQNSTAHQYLMSRYLVALRAKSQQVQTVAGDTRDLEFYTALITFKLAPPEQCAGGGDNDGASQSDRWQLCRPLNNIREARLWSSSDIKLEGVQWVSLNYMSGLDYEQRLRYSRFFQRDTRQPIKSRAEIDESNRATLQEMSPKPKKTLANTIKGARKPVSCFLSKLDHSADEAVTNFKCGRSGSELKYSMKLRPIRLQN